MAAASYPLYQFPAPARVTLNSTGHVVVEVGVAEIGVGNTAVLPFMAAEALGISVGRVSLAFGDTDLPFAPQAGGSRTVASVGRAILSACDDWRQKGAALNGSNVFSPDALSETLRLSGRDALSGEASWTPEQDAPFSSESYAAHFFEVAVSTCGEIRVRRFLSVVDAGRVAAR